MSILWSNVVDIAPELASISSGAQTTILTYVNAAFDPSMFDTTSIDLARAYLAAHLGTVTRWQGASIAGPVIREADGRLEREYSVIPSAMSTPFNTTSYGTLLQFLIDTSKARLPRVLL